MKPTGWTAMVAAEWLKIRTVRVPAVLAGAVVALTAVLAVQPVLGAGRSGSPSLGTAGAMLAVLGATSRGPLIALVLGVLIGWLGFRGGSANRYERNITEAGLYSDLYLLEAATGAIERLTNNPRPMPPLFVV